MRGVFKICCELKNRLTVDNGDFSDEETGTICVILYVVCYE